MNIKEVPIDEVKPYENNPRNNDEAVQATAHSIKEFGWQQPIVVDKNNIVIAGHTRLRAAKKLKLASVPILVADNLTDDQVRAYRLADNKTGELAIWDDNLLSDELNQIVDIDMEEFGFNLSEPEEKPLPDLSDNINEKFQVIIDCENEQDLQATYEKLTEEGYTCDISTL